MTPPSELHPAKLEGVLLQGTYRIETLIGEGGMAWIYRAHHEVLQGPVAIKVMREDAMRKSAHRERFLREAQVQYSLNHPHIVRVFDFLEEQGIIGFAQEWCDAGDLHQYLEEHPGPLPIEDIKQLFLPLLDALEEAHQQGLIHRDIKPHNILLQSKATTLLAKLNDFGLAKALDAEDLTQTGDVMGTLHYMPPEQFAETKRVDVRADIYALGVLLYRMLTGRLPFIGQMPALLFKITNHPYPKTPEAHPAFTPIFSQTLAKLPDERFASCLAFKAALQNALRIVEAESSVVSVVSVDSFAPDVSMASVASSATSASFHATTPPANISAQAPVPSVISAQEPVPSVSYTQKAWLFLSGFSLCLGLMILLWDAPPLISPNTPKVRTIPPRVIDSQQKLISQLHHENQLYFLRASRAMEKGNYGMARSILKFLCALPSRSKIFKRPFPPYIEQSCYWLGLLNQEAAYHITTLCPRGNQEMCIWLQTIKEKPDIEQALLQRSLQAYQQSCEMPEGKGRGCYAAARLVGHCKTLYPRHIRQSKQMRWLRLACQRGDGAGCAVQASQLGLHMPKQRANALTLFQRACRLIHPESCLAAVVLQRRPLGERQVKLRLQGLCQRFEPLGCETFRQMERFGVFSPQQAQTLLNRTQHSILTEFRRLFLPQWPWRHGPASRPTSRPITPTTQPKTPKASPYPSR